MKALIEAAKTGSVQETRRLLADGVEPNYIGADGNTALHEAVRNGHPQIAASLLSNGADWTLKNTDGKTALNLGFTNLPALHRIRQEYQRLPVAPYDGALAPSADVESYVSQLKRDGILKVSGLVEPEQLARMQSDFDRLVRKLNLSRIFFRKRFSHYDQDEYWHAKHRAYVTNDALACSAGLLSLCCNPIVIETANHYLHKISHIKRTYGMRYLPSDVEFTGDRNKNNLWGTALSRKRVPSSAYEANHPLKELLGATPKWKRTRNQAPRTRPSWAESLEDPSSWL